MQAMEPALPATRSTTLATQQPRKVESEEERLQRMDRDMRKWGMSDRARENLIRMIDQRRRAFRNGISPADQAIIDERKRQAKERRIERAIGECGIPLRFYDADHTFRQNERYEPFVVDTDNELAYRTLRDRVASWKIGDKGVIVASPTCGNGKTYLMSAAAISLIRRGFSVRMTTVAKLLDRFRDSFGNIYAKNPYAGSTADLMAEMTTCGVLILDELGGEAIKTDDRGNWAREQILKILDERWNSKLAVFGTTNLRPKPWMDNGRLVHESNIMDHYGQRTYSRLMSLADYVVMFGPDRRNPACVDDLFVDG